jgi:RNA-directed DNA polymerase
MAVFPLAPTGFLAVLLVSAVGFARTSVVIDLRALSPEAYRALDGLTLEERLWLRLADEGFESTPLADLRMTALVLSLTEGPDAWHLEARRGEQAVLGTYERRALDPKSSLSSSTRRSSFCEASRQRTRHRATHPKEGGKVRTISIPAIRDRVVQGALRLILEPIFEADFSDSSYGARPGRSAHKAIEKVQAGLRQRRHRVVDIDLSRYFDTIRHDRMLAKLARRVADGEVLALVKQFFKSTGDRGVPQGSPLSPLLANLALNDLDHILDRGAGFITYARYLDDMVVLAPDSDRGRKWADRALDRIRREAEAIGVSLNTEKTRIVTITDERAVFAFLGFEFRWVPSKKTRAWYPCMTPRPKKITAVLRQVRDVLRACRHLPVQTAVAQINPILRGWVNYFRVGNSSQAFAKIKYHVERKVRRFAARQSRHKGFGWKRWSKDVVYGTWGLFQDYHLEYATNVKARTSHAEP